jgi:pimeloyl-ACP methyl ester carboxylesterase
MGWIGSEGNPMLVDLVSMRTSDGVLLHGALTVPERPRGALLGIHGAWGNFYGTPVAQFLADAPDRGIAALSMNGRGHDLGSLGDGEQCIGFLRDLFEQAPLDLEAAAALLDDRGLGRFVAVAHSYGSHRATYWQAQPGSRRAAGIVLLSPAPELQAAASVFVDGAVEHHLARAAAHVAMGHPEHLVVLSSGAPVPMVAEAATVLSTWGPHTEADSRRHVGSIDVPVLVVVGRREPASYRRRAEETVDAAPDAELVVVDDDHYYRRHRADLGALVLDWIDRRELFGPTVTRVGDDK